MLRWFIRHVLLDPERASSMAPLMHQRRRFRWANRTGMRGLTDMVAPQAGVRGTVPGAGRGRRGVFGRGFRAWYRQAWILTAKERGPRRYPHMTHQPGAPTRRLAEGDGTRQPPRPVNPR
jgi:hypothetical protein